MTDLAQIRGRILTMETIVLRQDPLAVPQVHESTVAAMSMTGHPAGNVCKVHIYMDGSFKNAEGDAAEEAAWAFVVIPEHSCAEYSFHGFAAGALAVGSEVASPPAWVGAIKAGCDTAELAAITWACRWCIYRMCVKPSMCGLPVVLHVDSQHAISSVNGHARPAVNGEAVHFARAALETFSLVTVGWIAGHIGHPWNELADAAAKQAAHNPEMSATRHVGIVDPLLSHRQMDCLFLLRLSPSDRMQYPSMVDGAFSVTNHEELLSNVRRFFCVFPRPCVVSDGTKIRRGLCNQVLVVLFRRSTGRQRHLVPTPVSPLFDVVLLCCAVGGLLRRAIWV